MSPTSPVSMFRLLDYARPEPVADVPPVHLTSAVVLVRPDGYAAAWTLDQLRDSASVTDVVGRWTGRRVAA